MICTYVRMCIRTNQTTQTGGGLKATFLFLSNANLVMPVPSDVPDPLSRLICSFLKNLQKTNDHPGCSKARARKFHGDRGAGPRLPAGARRELCLGVKAEFFAPREALDTPNNCMVLWLVSRTSLARPAFAARRVFRARDLNHHVLCVHCGRKV